jgi:hypothetical protein
MGTIMYLVEGRENGFTSIPRSIYWAIVTLTTVGFGDITPQTPLGQTIAAFIMILGYGIIAVPTGIVTAEMTRHADDGTTHSCSGCGAEGHKSSMLIIAINADTELDLRQAIWAMKNNPSKNILFMLPDQRPVEKPVVAYRVSPLVKNRNHFM